MLKIMIYEDILLDMIAERLDSFNFLDDEQKECYLKFYKDNLYIFTEKDFNLKEIIDNDIINNTICDKIANIKNDYGDYFSQENILFCDDNDYIIYSKR